MRKRLPRLSPNSADGQSAGAGRDRLPPLGGGILPILVCRLKDQFKSYRKQLRKCRRKVSENAVHDLRVEARRLISLLDLMSSFVPARCVRKAYQELKCHLDTFDDLRDTHVQLSIVRKLRKGFPAARRFHRFLKKREAEFRRTAGKNSKQLQIKPLGKLTKAARDCAIQWLRCHSPRHANLLLIRTIKRAFHRVKLLRKRIKPSDTHSIHCTRIAFKKFRYMLEVLDNGAVTLSKPLLERLRHYQGLMGDIQDAEVLLRAFEKFVRKEKPQVGPALQFTEVLLDRRKKLVDKYLAVADELATFWPYNFKVRESCSGNNNTNNQTRKTPRSSGAREAVPLKKPL